MPELRAVVADSTVEKIWESDTASDGTGFRTSLEQETRAVRPISAMYMIFFIMRSI